MISLFFHINRGKFVIRMAVEEYVVIPAAILFTAFAVYDHKKQCWLKLSSNWPETTDPEALGDIAHTFFHPIGLAWHIVGDNRFTRNFRMMCARIVVVNAKNHLQGEALYNLENYMKAGCYVGEFVSQKNVIQDSDSSYNYFPL